METTMFIAKLLGPIFLIVWLSAVFNTKFMSKVLDELIGSEVSLFMIGFLRFTLWLTVVLVHNTWNGFLEVIVSLLGWIMLVAGWLILLFPNHMKKMGKGMAKNKTLMNIAYLVFLLIWVVITYLAFFGA